LYLFTNTLVVSKLSRFIREADRIDILRQSGYPKSVIDWSIGRTPNIAHKYADLPAIILSRKLKSEGLKITRYDRDPRVKELVNSVLSHEDEAGLGGKMKEVMDSIAWLMSINREFGIDLYDSSENELFNWARQTHDFMKRYEVADPSQYAGPVVFTDEDGWTINELTPEDCKIEGSLMEHCVGGYSYNVFSGDTRIFSLRDPRGMPHMTMEFEVEKYVGKDGKEKTRLKLIQSKGRSNHQPKEEYVDTAREWLQSVDGENGVDFVDARDDRNREFERFEYYYGWDYEQNNDDDYYGIEQDKPDDPLGGFDYGWILEAINDEMNDSHVDEEGVIGGALNYIKDYRNPDEFKEFLRDFIEQTQPVDMDAYRRDYVLEHMGLEEPIRVIYNTDKEFQDAVNRYKTAIESAPPPASETDVAKAVTADKLLSPPWDDNKDESYLRDPDRPWKPTPREEKNQLWLPFSSSNYIFLR